MADEVLIRLPRSQVPGFDPEREQVGLVYASEDAIVLRRLRLAASGEAVRDFLRLYGTSRTLSAADLFHALNLNHATGLVVFEADAIRRRVYMRNGEIIFAQSNQDNDRLGESLIRAGKITQAQLDLAAKSITSERKLGQILVEDGLISPKELFIGVRRQVEEIVWALFDWNAKFVFFEGFADPESVIALNLETQKLIIEGLRRTKAWAHIPIDVPEREIILQLSANPKNLRLNQEEQRLAALVVAGISLRALIDQAGFGQLETYKVVHHMLQRELIMLGVRGKQSPVDLPSSGEILKMIENFQNVFSEIIALIKMRSPDFGVIERLNSFFDALPEDLLSVFGSVRFAWDGSLDAQKIVENAQLVAGNSRAKVLKAFNELLYFTLFEMKNVLSDNDTKRIMDVIENMEMF